MTPPEFDLQRMLFFAVDLAHEAGALLKDAYAKPRQIDFKGSVNLVTQADHAAEELIVTRLQKHTPDYGILAEERGLVNEQTAFQWLVDPLDGTNNFAHGFPVFAVSIGLQYEGEPLLGVIYDPLRDECFSAAKGTGARLNDKPIRVSSIAQLEQGLLATGFPYDRQTTEDNNSQAVAAFLRKGQGIRRAGAAALDLAYVACGRLDGYWEQRLNPWDIAAGLVIVREAGGMITPYSGKFDDAPVLRGENVVASNGLIHDAMLAVLDSVYIYTDSGMPQLK